MAAREEPTCWIANMMRKLAKREKISDNVINQSVVLSSDEIDGRVFHFNRSSGERTIIEKRALMQINRVGDIFSRILWSRA